MSNKPLQKVESGRNKLIICFVIVLLIALFLANSWSKEWEFNRLTRRESSPLSLALGSAAVESAVLACVLLACAFVASKKPKITFGVGMAIGAACILWSLRGFYLSAEVLSAVAGPGIEAERGAEFAAGFMSVVLPSAVGHLIVGTFVLLFCVPALKAAREFEEMEAGPVVPSGRYGSLVTGSLQTTEYRSPASGTAPTSKEVVCPKCQARILDEESGPLKCDFCGALVRG